jgi:surface-anchored protein
MFTNGVFGTPTVWMSTTNGISSSDTFIFTAGTHAHMNWAFTSSGIYELDMRASAFINDELGGLVPVTSDLVTYRFGVEVAPEPASMLALASGLVGFIGVGLKRRRK